MNLEWARLIIYVEMLYMILATLVPVDLTCIVDYDWILWSTLAYILTACSPIYDAILIIVSYLVTQFFFLPRMYVDK